MLNESLCRIWQVLTANLGSAKQALEAGADISWLPLPLQFNKEAEEKL